MTSQCVHIQMNVTSSHPFPIVHSPVKDETHSGIIILISKEYEILDETETLPGRLFTVKLEKRGIETVCTLCVA